MSQENKNYIALIDCDSFFCSCERRLDPSLNGKPVAVTTGERGCVVSRTKEAKMLGVKMGEPVFKAIKDHPKCIYISAKHEEYIKISREVMEILKSLSPLVEVYSVDEAFVDLTGLLRMYKKNYFDFAKYVQDRILNEAKIPVSIGVSRSKTLAKVASYRAKTTKERIVLLGKRKIESFLKNIDISEVWGIGRRLDSKLKSLGVFTAYEFSQKEDWWVKAHFGKNGLATKYELLGEMVSPVINEHTLPKSIMDTQSFPMFTSDIDYLRNELLMHIHITCLKLRYVECKCKKIGVLLKTKDFKCYFLQSKLLYSTNLELDISDLAFKLLDELYEPSVLYRSVGIVLEDLSVDSEEQLDFFVDPYKKEKRLNLGKTLDKLEEKFGKNIVKLAGI